MKERKAKMQGIEEGIEQGKYLVIKTLLESQEPEKVAQMQKI